MFVTIIFTDKLIIIASFIDITIIDMHNLQETWNRNVTSTRILRKNIWKQRTVYIVPITVSATGIIWQVSLD